MKQGKIAIIGAGAVGSTTAYALSLQKIVAEIILIDVDEKRCRGETLDLTDIYALSPSTHIRSGTMKDAEQSDIVIIAAGKRQEEGESRTNMFEQNKKVIKTICSQLIGIQKNAIVIMVTNPIDPLTLLAQNLLSISRNHIFGSGTILDSLRLRKYIGAALSVSPQSVSGVILGEHGDTQFAQWSSVQINGAPLCHFQLFDESKKKEIAEKVKKEAYEIIACKGATFFGVASCVALLCRAILYNEKIALPLSCFLQKENICISLPVILASDGIISYLPLSFNQEEDKCFEKSVHFIKQYQI
jgi:L-lactate dehydrogenase